VVPGTASPCPRPTRGGGTCIGDSARARRVVGASPLLSFRRPLPEEQGGAADTTHDLGSVVDRQALHGALARVAIVGGDADLDQLVVPEGAFQRDADTRGDT
jgi:hypothetical protein